MEKEATPPAAKFPTGTVISGGLWTGEVFRIAEFIRSVYVLNVDHEKDGGKPGHADASHAEKQIVAYFLHQHVFLPTDAAPNELLEDAISAKLDNIEREYFTPIGQDIGKHTKQRKKRDAELLNKDDRVREDYDEEEVKKIQQELGKVRQTLATLYQTSKGTEIRNLERDLDQLERKQVSHSSLIGISRTPAPISVKVATITISSYGRNICDSCKAYVEAVNSLFGLNLLLEERTIH